VLEELTHALQRGAPILAEVAGFGMCGDGHHITDPDLAGAIRCMSRALADAGLEPEDIDYINPHATSTPVGDRNEARAIGRLFPHQPLVSATKSQTGHLLGAAGAVEAIFTMSQHLPRGYSRRPEPGTDRSGDCSPLQVVVGEPVRRSMRAALSNSFGFGGTNAASGLQAVPVGFSAAGERQ
jgi:3-oxoacyl-[acyl-carrier-protein] synthase II